MTCRALDNLLNAPNFFGQSNYMGQVSVDAQNVGGRFEADALRLQSASGASDRDNAVAHLENDCDSAGHRYNW